MLILNHKVLLNKWKSFTVAYFKIYYSKSLFIKYDELCTYINYWKSAFFYKMKNNFAKSIVYLQSQKQLYNIQCPFICLSLGLGCTDCDKPIWAPLHHSTLGQCSDWFVAICMIFFLGKLLIPLRINELLKLHRITLLIRKNLSTFQNKNTKICQS